MKKCVSCNRVTETKQVCHDCHRQLCSDCRTKTMLCNTCLAIREDKNNYVSYLCEKYMIGGTSTRVPPINMHKAFIILVCLLLVPFAYSQLSTSDYKKTCILVNDDYWTKEAVYETKLVFNITTGKNDNVTVFKEYKDVLIKQNKDVCNETVTIGSKDVDFKLQGYNCKNSTGEVICDSCNGDGNCDGVCASNGGESCVRIKDGVLQYKNSVVSWNDKSGLYVVPKLEVR